MPVKGLETFSVNAPGVLVDINLKELIKQEFANTGCRPNIVFEGSSLPFFFKSDEPGFLGQPALTAIKIENFFDQIISYGANVIVVLKVSYDSEPDNWLIKEKKKLFLESQKCKTYKETQNIYYKFVKSATHFCCTQTLTSISKEHYTVFITAKETVKEMAEIALKENCLAVVSQDSNCVIYEGIRFFILLKTLDIKTFNCKFYDRNNLLKCLGLKSSQLPIFATLCGNEVVPFYLLNSFHRRITDLKCAPPLCVAEKVKHMSSDPYRYIQELVDLIAHKEITERTIRKSLDMYLKFEEIQPHESLKFALERVRKGDWNITLCNIFLKREFYSKRLTDICNVGLGTFETMRPIRQKLYGILFHSDDRFVKEYFLEEMLPSNYRRPKPKTVCKICTTENPGLIELYLNRTPKINFLRWELFLNCVSETLSFSVVRIVPQKYLFPVLALHYLLVKIPAYFQGKKVFKKMFELEAFLLGVLLLNEYPRARLEALEENEPDPWELQLHVLYIDMCFNLSLINRACGFVIPKEKACICSFYDGKLTHWIYNKMKRGATRDEFFESNPLLETLHCTLLGLIVTE